MARSAINHSQQDNLGNPAHITNTLKSKNDKISQPTEMTAAEKAQFDKDCEEGLSVDEVFDDLKEYVRKTWNEWNKTR